MSVVAQALKKGVIILIIFNDVYLNLYLISPCHFRMFGSDTTSSKSSFDDDNDDIEDLESLLKS